jgi:hypothetical protein
MGSASNAISNAVSNAVAVAIAIALQVEWSTERTLSSQAAAIRRAGKTGEAASPSRRWGSRVIGEVSCIVYCSRPDRWWFRSRRSAGGGGKHRVSRRGHDGGSAVAVAAGERRGDLCYVCDGWHAIFPPFLPWLAGFLGWLAGWLMISLVLSCMCSPASALFSSTLSQTLSQTRQQLHGVDVSEGHRDCDGSVTACNEEEDDDEEEGGEGGDSSGRTPHPDTVDIVGALQHTLGCLENLFRTQVRDI